MMYPNGYDRHVDPENVATDPRTWDVGACEYTGTYVPAPPPSNKRLSSETTTRTLQLVERIAAELGIAVE